MDHPVVKDFAVQWRARADDAEFQAVRRAAEAIDAEYRRIPRERMRYALDIPYIARENSAAEIQALRRAWARGTS